ncbi:hypothetical protein IMY05_C4202000200 [Salix suchowensis]|nr:hypothetical protein IMY05_C4202000200 [Salix suchowensis]
MDGKTKKNEAHTERVGMNKKSLQGQKTSELLGVSPDSVAGIEEAYLRVSRLQCQVSILLDDILQDSGCGKLWNKGHSIYLRLQSFINDLDIFSVSHWKASTSTGHMQGRDSCIRNRLAILTIYVVMSSHGPLDLDETALQYIDPELVRRKATASLAGMSDVLPGTISDCAAYSQEMNGEYFERTTLQALGLRIQLGHLKGSASILKGVPFFHCASYKEYIWSTSTFVAAISVSATSSNSFKVDGTQPQSITRKLAQRLSY